MTTLEAQLDAWCQEIDRLADRWRPVLRRRPDLRPIAEARLLPAATEAVRLVMAHPELRKYTKV